MLSVKWQPSCIGLNLLTEAMMAWFIDSYMHHLLDTLRPEQNGWHFAHDIFKKIFLMENDCILIQIWIKFVAVEQNPRCHMAFPGHIELIYLLIFFLEYYCIIQLFLSSL